MQADQQVCVLRRLIYAVIILASVGTAVTWYVSRDATMICLYTIIAATLIITGIVSLILLYRGSVVLATVLVSMSLHIATAIAIIPYGIADSPVLVIGFIIPLILLSYIWGYTGAIISIALTTSSYIILYFLERMGLTGWAIHIRVLWIDAGTQMLALVLIAIVIVHSQSALVSTNRQLIEAQQDLEKFLQRIAHDMAQPLQGLYVAFDSLDAAQKNNMAPHLNVLRVFIDQTRTFVEVKERGSLSKERVSILSICAASMMSFTHQALNKRVCLNLDCDIENPLVSGDEIAIRRIIDNLLINAIRFTIPESSVTIRVHEFDPSLIEIDIIDNGPGMSIEEQKHIFKQKAHSFAGGWGIGLMIVRELTTAMNGFYGFASSADGSTFWIRLPVWNTDEQADSSH